MGFVVVFISWCVCCFVFLGLVLSGLGGLLLVGCVILFDCFLVLIVWFVWFVLFGMLFVC